MTENNLGTHQTSNPFRFAISATFTAEPIRRTIGFWARQLNADFEVRFAPYNQLLQSLVDPQSELALNTNGVNVLLARLEDLGQFRSGATDPHSRIEKNVHHLIQELLGASSRLSAPLIFCLCPSSSAFTGEEEFTSRMRSLFSTATQGSANVHCLDYCDIERLYPVENPLDPEGERLGKIPYTDLYFCALGTSIVRYAHALARPPYKLVALDCDNTLWQGICGEDGPEGVVLDAPRRALQNFMLEQRESGMLLTMASKNNERDVLDTFAVHPEMPLQLRHFAAWRLNWNAKSENVVELAEQLGLGLDSFIFVDDNPKECAEIAGAVPEVLALTLPEDINQTAHFLAHVWAFDRPVVTEEDRKRNTYYEKAQQFGDEIRSASNLQDFMASLDLRVTLKPMTGDRLARVAQLTQRTNQFNFTTIRRSEADIASILRAGYECYIVEASDRFGDYGLVGVLIVSRTSTELLVDTFLLSCRALGRGVEHRMLAFLGQLAAESGLETVVLTLNPTPKNQPARQFLESIDFGSRVDGSDRTSVILPSSAAQAFVWRASARPSPVRVVSEPTSQPAHARKVDYACIAGQLSTAEAILQKVRAEVRPAMARESMTEIETKLAHIWAELLELPTVSRHDNFFDIGGHSLVAVLLLLRIRETFAVELSIDDVYSGTLTLADLATRIETAQLADVDPEEYAALLAEIEGLSDEQARELLEQGQADRP